MNVTKSLKRWEFQFQLEENNFFIFTVHEMNGFFVCTPVFCGVEKVAVVRMIVINGFKSVHFMTCKKHL